MTVTYIDPYRQGTAIICQCGKVIITFVWTAARTSVTTETFDTRRRARVVEPRTAETDYYYGGERTK